MVTIQTERQSGWGFRVRLPSCYHVLLSAFKQIMDSNTARWKPLVRLAQTRRARGKDTVDWYAPYDRYQHQANICDP